MDDNEKRLEILRRTKKRRKQVDITFILAALAVLFLLAGIYLGQAVYYILFVGCDDRGPAPHQAPVGGAGPQGAGKEQRLIPQKSKTEHPFRARRGCSNFYSHSCFNRRSMPMTVSRVRFRSYARFSSWAMRPGGQA